MTIFIIWFLCGIVAAIIGADKGEAFLGFLIGITLGPLGVILAIFSKGNRKKCRFCREYVHKRAVACPHCQRNIG